MPRAPRIGRHGLGRVGDWHPTHRAFAWRERSGPITVASILAAVFSVVWIGYHGPLVIVAAITVAVCLAGALVEAVAGRLMARRSCPPAA